MYGLVNKALREMIREKFGEEAWERVLAVSEVPHDSFITMNTYDDQITYQLAGAAAAVLEAPVEQCLEMFGEYWMLRAAPETYEDLLRYTGSDVLSFFENLNNLHDRITTTFMGYKPPSFYLERHDDSSVSLRYESCRSGLTPFVGGLIRGISRRFATPIEVLAVETSNVDGGETSMFRLRVG